MKRILTTTTALIAVAAAPAFAESMQPAKSAAEGLKPASETSQSDTTTLTDEVESAKSDAEGMPSVAEPAEQASTELLEDTQSVKTEANQGTNPLGGATVEEMEGFEVVAASDVDIELVDGVIAYDSNREWVGEVGSVLVDDQDQVVAAVIDVGGFLGIGEKEVAIAIDDLSVLRAVDGNEVQVVVNATEAELKAMPTYDS